MQTWKHEVRNRGGGFHPQPGMPHLLAVLERISMVATTAIFTLLTPVDISHTHTHTHTYIFML